MGLLLGIVVLLWCRSCPWDKTEDEGDEEYEERLEEDYAGWKEMVVVRVLAALFWIDLED